MPLPARLIILKICNQNRSHGKFISLITGALQRKSSPPHFRRFFSSNNSAAVDDDELASGTTKAATTNSSEAMSEHPAPESGTWKEYPAPQPGAWNCSNCGYLNWPNKVLCKRCTIGVPTDAQREILAKIGITTTPEEAIEYSDTAEGGWACSVCNHLNWPQQRLCKKCTVGAPNDAQRELLNKIVWVCPKCTHRTNADNCVYCGLARCTVHDGFWVCSNCKWRNIPVHASCRKCILGRPTEDQIELIKTHCWVCGICRHHNFTDECFKCGSSKSKRLPEGAGGESLADGAWYCKRCRFLNFPNYLKCKGCAKGKPTSEQLDAIRSARWVCTGCGYFNYPSNATCYKCSKPMPDEKPAFVPFSTTSHLDNSLHDGSWFCSNCQWANTPCQVVCHNCSIGKPNEKQMQQILKHRWICGKCRHHNHADECFKCGASKSERLLTIEEGLLDGKLLLADGSWYCNSCFSLNFYSELMCKKCQGLPTDEQFAVTSKLILANEEKQEKKRQLEKVQKGILNSQWQK